MFKFLAIFLLMTGLGFSTTSPAMAATPQEIQDQARRAVQQRQQQLEQQQLQQEEQSEPVAENPNSATSASHLETRIITRYSWFNGLITIREHQGQYYLHLF